MFIINCPFCRECNKGEKLMPSDETKITELLKIFHSLNQEDQEWVIAILPRILEIKEDDRQH